MLAVNLIDFSAKDSDKEIFRLNDEGLKILENTDILSPGEKMDVVLISLGKKMISEVAMENDDPSGYEKVLSEIGIPHRRDGQHLQSKWISIGINRAIFKYIDERREVLSEVEIGALYGFPVTHSLAFSGVLKERTRKDSALQGYYFGGVYSDDFFDLEKEYFDTMWSYAKGVSPIIAKQAEEYFLSK